MPLRGERSRKDVTVEQFDAAAAALYRHATGEEPGEGFVSIESDHWYVLARVTLEAAGLRVP